MNEMIAIADRVQAAKQDSLAADDLIRDYLPFIRSETAALCKKRPGQSIDDELSIAMLGFHEAIQGYNASKGPFLGFASRIMKHRLIDYFRQEKRHYGQISLSTPVTNDSETTLEEMLPDEVRHEEVYDSRQATKQEIAELSNQLDRFGLSLSAIADNAPKQGRTKRQCLQALKYAKAHPLLIQETIRTGRLPLTALVDGAGVEKKTLERHRKYLMALLVIYSNGYEMIRGHLKQVLVRQTEVHP